MHPFQSGFWCQISVPGNKLIAFLVPELAIGIHCIFRFNELYEQKSHQSIIHTCSVYEKLYKIVWLWRQFRTSHAVARNSPYQRTAGEHHQPTLECNFIKNVHLNSTFPKVTIHGKNPQTWLVHLKPEL